MTGLCIPVRWRDPQIIAAHTVWDPTQTVVIVCDMWDKHWCMGASQRVNELVGPMNRMLLATRQMGIRVIHCPSGVQHFYTGWPQRLLAQEVTPQILPPWTDPYSDVVGVNDGCDDPVKCPEVGVWTRQHPGIEICAGDAIADYLEPLYLIAAWNITNVLLVGVHVNICLLRRPFGICNLLSRGLKVLLVRDLTDSLYNSRLPPFIDNHYAGTDFFIQDIETRLCPTTISTTFTGQSPFKFREDRR